MTNRTLPPPDFVQNASPERRESVVMSERGLRLEIGRTTNPTQKKDLFLELARHLEATDPRGAIAALESSVAVADSPVVRRKLSELRARSGEMQRAAAELLAAADASTDPQERHTALHDAAVMFVRDGDADGVRSVIERAPEDGELHACLLPVFHAAPDEARVPALVTQLAAFAGEDSLAWRRIVELDPAVGGAGLMRLLPHAVTDEVVRLGAQGRSAEPSVHDLRLGWARDRGLPQHALAAGLDAGLDLQLEGEGARTFDRILTTVGLHEVVAARLEARVDVVARDEKVATLLELGDVYAQPLANPALAVEAYGAALAIDPASEDALERLRPYGAAPTRDRYVDALARAVATPRLGAAEARIRCADTLARFADLHGLGALATWAREQARRLGPGAEETLSRPGDEVPAILAALSSAVGPERAALLEEAAARLRTLPDQFEARDRVMTELVEDGRSSDRELREEWVRLAALRADSSELVRRLRIIVTSSEGGERERALGRLVFAERRRGDVEAASATARELFAGAPTARSAAVAWIQSAIEGDPRLRAEAIALAGAVEVSDLRGTLLTWAAEQLLAQGSPRAIEVARDAIAALPELPRTRVLEAQLAALAGRGVDALERAIAHLGPVGPLLRDLAKRAVAEQRFDEALGALEKLCALRPGDAAFAVECLRLRNARKNADEIAQAIEWAVELPVSNTSLAAPVAEALGSLLELDSTLARRAAQQALDRFGLADESLRATLLRVAERTKNDAFAVTILEQWISAESPATNGRGELYLALAQRKSSLGDVNGEATALASAVVNGADPRTTQVWLDQLSMSLPNLAPDVAFALVEARVTQAERTNDRARLSRALRDQGRLLWDTLGERDEAVALWVRAARTAPQLGIPALGADLHSYLGPNAALRILRDLIDREDEPEMAGAFCAEAARAALQAHDVTSAFAFAHRALSQNPARADALEIAERGSATVGRVREMSPLYSLVASSALGRFARRAAHYRAARFFESYGEADLAVSHASHAFLAVPSEGATYLLLTRTAARGQSQVAVETLERVAEESASAGARAAWLRRAALLASDDEVGAPMKVDLLLRALSLAAGTGVIDELSAAAKSLLGHAPEERSMLEMRLERARAALQKKLEGPDGARVAIALARLACEVMEGHGALESVRLALNLAGDIEEFVSLMPHAAGLAAREGAAGVGACLDLVEGPYANIGEQAAVLVLALARATERPDLLARAVVAAVERIEGEAWVLDAEAALRAHPNAALEARFEKACDRDRLGRALLAGGRAALEQGDVHRGHELLRRALALGDAETREAANQSLSLEWAQGTEADQGPMSGPIEERAAAWSHIASQREMAGDPQGALAAWRLAAEADPVPLERFIAIERAAEAAGDVEARIAAIEVQISRLHGEDAYEAKKRLARALEYVRRNADAEKVWLDVLATHPADDEADLAVESFIAGRGEFDKLAEHLRRRIDRMTAAGDDSARAVRLRLAAVLEQRLDRLEEACEVLETLAKDSHESALRYLADLRERLGDADAAVILWRRVETLVGPDGVRDVRLRLGRALLAAGSVEEAVQTADDLFAADMESLDVLALRVEVLRHLPGRGSQLGEAIELFVHASPADAAERSELLIEAAQAAARGGDVYLSLSRAQRAAEICPTSPKAQLFARGLEYRLRGAGTPEEARKSVTELSRLPVELAADDAALRAFLLAEALDATEGSNAGARILMDARLAVGLLPLIALGLAERAAARKEPKEAVLLYREALTGDLLTLRRSGTVALAAAELAEQIADVDACVFFLECAIDDASSRARAERKLFDLSLSRGDVPRGLSLARSIVETTPWDDKLEITIALGKTLVQHADAVFVAEGVRLLKEAGRLASEGSELYAEVARELAQVGERFSRSSNPAADARITSASVRISRTSLVPGTGLLPVVDPSPQLSFGGVDGDRRALLGGRDVEPVVDRLKEAALGGSVDAADALGDYFERRPGATAELLRFRRMAAELRPGDLALLHKVREVALRDNNVNYARALDHVLRAFDPAAGPLEPPPLSAQAEQPGILQLLVKHSNEPAGIAMGLLWESAGSVLLRTLLAPAVGVLERVVPGPSSQLGRILELSIRLLDIPRTPVFWARRTERAEAPVYRVTLGSPPAGVVGGSSQDDTAALRFALGQALAGAAPHNALLLAPEEPRVLWDALLRAFGPEDAAASPIAASKPLVELLWQTVPGRVQKRLKELLEQEGKVPFDLVRERARQSGRRVGLFLSGDFAHAAQATLADFGETTAPSVDGLVEACRRVPSLADLYRLAIRPEYADARWTISAPMRARTSPA